MEEILDIFFKYDIVDIDWMLVSDILKIAGLSSPEPKICEKAFQRSQVTVFAFDDSKMIGCARAISDGVRQAAIYDVALLPEYQGKGIGRILLESIMEKLPGCNFILYSNLGKEVFYEKMGYRRLKTGMAKFVNADNMKKRGFTE
jgi:ribosomal protein S18 acetylase RimI-like enzyme